MRRHEISLGITDRSERVRLQPLLGAEQTVGLREDLEVALGRLRGRDAACVGDLAPHAEELGPTVHKVPPNRRYHHRIDRRDRSQERRGQLDAAIDGAASVAFTHPFTHIGTHYYYH